MFRYPKGSHIPRSIYRQSAAAARCGAVALCWLSCCASVRAETAAQPKWELGLGVGALTTADYVGSDERQQVVLPAPYVVYRGERVQADRGGLRSTLFEAGPLELKLSLSATPPVRTNDNNERKDMPDLDPSFEVGPELRWHIWESASERVAWDVRVPLRFVYAVGDGRVHSIGTAVSPMLSVDVRDVFHQGWKFGLNAGPVFADRSLNDYYYGVALAYLGPTTGLSRSNHWHI